MKQLGVLLLPHVSDASPSQGTQHEATSREMLVHHRVLSMQQLGVSLLPPGWDASLPRLP